MGKLSLITGIGPAEMNAIFRIIGGIVFLISVILLIRAVLPKDYRKTAFLIFLLAEPFPSMKYSIINEWYSQWVWHFGDAARRISIVPPHYSIGKGLALLSLYFLFAYLNSERKKHLLPALFFTVIAGLIYPPPNF